MSFEPGTIDRPRLARAALLLALAARMPAQEAQPLPPVERWVTSRPSSRADAKWTLWAEFPPPLARLREQAAYLGELQRRYGPAGLRVVVLLPETLVAQHEPRGYELATATLGPSIRMSLVDAGAAGAPLWTGNDSDGIADVLEDLAAGRPGNARAADAARLFAWIEPRIDDGPDLGESVARLLEVAPRCGRAHAWSFQNTLWMKADLEAAQALALKALDALAGESWPLVECCDLVLRAARPDPVLAARIANALDPVVAQEPDNVEARLAQLRARIHAGQRELYEGAARALEPLVRRDAAWLVRFVETLAELPPGAPSAKVFRPLAESALKRALLLAADRRLVAAAAYKVDLRLANDPEAAAAAAQQYLAASEGSINLNNDAWYFLVQRDTMGRFDALALHMMKKLEAEHGEELDSALLDTLALALFMNGKTAEAVEAETKALAQNTGDPRYESRLLRFQRAREREKLKR